MQVVNHTAIMSTHVNSDKIRQVAYSGETNMFA